MNKKLRDAYKAILEKKIFNSVPHNRNLNENYNYMMAGWWETLKGLLGVRFARKFKTFEDFKISRLEFTGVSGLLRINRIGKGSWHGYGMGRTSSDDAGIQRMREFLDEMNELFRPGYGHGGRPPYGWPEDGVIQELVIDENGHHLVTPDGIRWWHLHPAGPIELPTGWQPGNDFPPGWEPGPGWNDPDYIPPFYAPGLNPGTDPTVINPGDGVPPLLRRPRTPPTSPTPPAEQEIIPRWDPEMGDPGDQAVSGMYPPNFGNNPYYG